MKWSWKPLDKAAKGSHSYGRHLLYDAPHGVGYESHRVEHSSGKELHQVKKHTWSFHKGGSLLPSAEAPERKGGAKQAVKTVSNVNGNVHTDTTHFHHRVNVPGTVGVGAGAYAGHSYVTNKGRAEDRHPGGY